MVGAVTAPLPFDSKQHHGVRLTVFIQVHVYNLTVIGVFRPSILGNFHRNHVTDRSLQCGIRLSGVRLDTLRIGGRSVFFNTFFSQAQALLLALGNELSHQRAVHFFQVLTGEFHHSLTAEGLCIAQEPA